MQQRQRHYSSARNFKKSFAPRRRNAPKKQSIHASKFINKSVTTRTDKPYEPTHSFADFGFSPALADNLARIEFVKPSAIQDQAISLIQEGRDVIGLADTGTGKTAAFLLPTLEKLYRRRTTTSVLVVAPTRELAQQIDAECKRFGEGLKIYTALCVGGVNIRPQIRNLQRRPHIIIGTPGRLMDLMRQKELQLDAVSTLVLDEADRMLDMGFVHDIREIASKTAPDRQTLCFSATITPGVKAIINDFMTSPELISVRRSETSNHIYQDVIQYGDEVHKKDLLLAMLSDDKYEKVVVFGETKYGVQRLAEKLQKSGIPSTAIHGNKSQSQRQRALNDFKTNRTRVLVATDVAARGLDIPDVSHVINYDTPTTYDDYIHRIGRTGRSGKGGTALTFVRASDYRAAHV